MALPALEVMFPTTALAMTASSPVRMGFIFVPNGMSMPQWKPAAPGILGELPKVLEPLQNVKGSINVLSGLAQANGFALGDGPGDHARSAATWLTGVHPKKTAGADIHVGISADQVAAMRLGGHTPFPSLELGCEAGAIAGNCDSGYSCAYSSSISWRSESLPMAKETNPRLVFERLFGDGSEDAIESRAKRDRYRLSILDFVLEEANGLRGKLGTRDKQKLDEYLNGVREIELRIQKAEKAAKLTNSGHPPTGSPTDFGEHIRLMGDMMVLAFQSDMTRVSTFMIANEGSNRAYPEIGVPDGHHEMSHHGTDPERLRKKFEIDHFHVKQLAYILERMAAIKEPGGTLLDNSMIVYGGGICDGDRHNHDDLPLLVAGRGGNKLQTGRHLVYNNGTPLNNLYLAMLDKYGIPVETLGDSTGKLAPLF